jgi:hypothetical protein
MAAARVDRALCICTTLEEFDACMPGAGARQLLVHGGRAPRQRRRARADGGRPAGAGRPPRGGGIGETGLDYYRLNGRSVADMAWQRERFRGAHPGRARQRAAAGGPHPQRRTTPWRMLRSEGQGRWAACSTASPRPPRWRAPRWTWASHLVFRHPDLPQRRGTARSGALRAAGPLPDRDRQPLPGADAAPRQDQHPAWVPHVARSWRAEGPAGATVAGARGAVDARAPNGNTPLMLAARYGHEDSVSLLLEGRRPQAAQRTQP